MFFFAIPSCPYPPQGSEESSADSTWSIGSRGIVFAPSSDVEFRLGGRAQLDAAFFHSDLTPIDDESGFRRLRVTLRGDVQDFSLLVERDVGGTTKGWKEMWLRYEGLDALEITAGNQIAPFSLDALTGSSNLVFLERALPNALAAGLYTGIAARAHGDAWYLAGGYFGDPIDNEPVKHSNGRGVVARATVAPLRGKSGVLHFGADAEYRSIDEGSEYRIRSRPESGLTRVRLVDTRRILDVNDTQSYGLEAAAALGPFQVQGEYIRSDLDRDSIDVSFDGAYAQAAWILTGEHRQYRPERGTFLALQPDSGAGIWELAARWSTIDLTDEDILGGEQTDVTVGLNWYMNRNVRWMADYGFIDAHPNRQGFDEEARVLQFRLQIGF